MNTRMGSIPSLRRRGESDSGSRGANDSRSLLSTKSAGGGMRFFRNIKVRMTLWYLLIVAVLVALSGFLSYVLLARGLERRAVYPWDMQVSTVQSGSGDDFGMSDFSPVFDWESRMRGVSVTIRGYRVGELLEYATDKRSIEMPASEGTIEIDPGLLVRPGMTEDQQVWLYFYPLRDQPGTYELLEVAQSIADKKATLELFRNTIVTTALVTLAVAGLFGFFLVWRMLRPLQSITQVARGIGGRDLSRRLPVHRDDEVGDLALTLNRMFDRVENAFDTERQVASDLSHELRTPLAVMKSEASQALRKEKGDDAYQRALETVSREVSHVSSVAERLLFLARSDNGGDLPLAPVDLKELVTEVGWDTRVLCEEKGITFRSDLSGEPQRCIVHGDKVRLRELFLNLVNNAVRYTPSGGQITLSLCVQDRYVRASVTDTGIGISKEHLPHIFERFYRVDGGPSKDGGAGLGLAICKRIAELHGGRIEVKSKVGEGSMFTVILPLRGSTRDPNPES